MTFFENRYLEIKERFLLVAESSTSQYITEKMISLPERLVKCIWYDQLLDKKLMKTADGRRIKVFSPGEWNLGPGPDFLSAYFQIEGGEPVNSDVEIHVRSSGWKQHGHHKNPEYNGVTLHVTMWNDIDKPFITNKNSEEIPQLVLASCLSEDIATLATSIDMENYPYNSDSRIGLCHNGTESNPERARQLLEMAARERFFLKARRFSKELSHTKFEDILYHGIMEGLGYRRNKMPFRRLADSVPLRLAKEIRDSVPRMERRTAIEAVYFGASGLFSNIEIDMWDEDTREYSETLADYWEQFKEKLGPDDVMQKKEWTMRGVRPANFPVRRVAGLCSLMAEEGTSELVKKVLLFGGTIKECSDIRDMKRTMDILCESLSVEGEGYWAHHMTPGGKRLESAPSLIGKPLAMTLTLNIILPLLLGYAQEDNDTALRDRLTELYAVFPQLHDNQISKIMNYRLWGNTAGSKELKKREIMQQGLIQIFFDFCDENIRDCDNCALPKMLSKG